MRMGQNLLYVVSLITTAWMKLSTYYNINLKEKYLRKSKCSTLSYLVISLEDLIFTRGLWIIIILSSGILELVCNVIRYSLGKSRLYWKKGHVRYTNSTLFNIFYNLPSRVTSKSSRPKEISLSVTAQVWNCKEYNISRVPWR